MSIHLVVPDPSLFRTKSGSIWGLVYFELEATAFPGRGWTDDAVAFASAWLEALTKLLVGSSKREFVWFFDGPMVIELLSKGGGCMELRFLDHERLKESSHEDIQLLVSDALLVTAHLLESCGQRGWENHDTKALKAIVRRVERMKIKMK